MSAITKQYFSEDGKAAFYDIVRQNLFEGLELKNFSSLCRILERGELCGQSRVNHMKAWHSFFEFHYDANSYRIIIDKIYAFDEIKPYKGKMPKNAKSKSDKKKAFYYKDYAIPLLQHYAYLQKNNWKITEVNILDIPVILGMANKNCAELSETIQKAYKNKNYDSIYKQILVYETANSIIFNSIWENILKHMYKKDLLESFNKIYYINKGGEIRQENYEEAKYIDSYSEICSLQADSESLWGTIKTRRTMDLLNKMLVTKQGFQIEYIKYRLIMGKLFTPIELDEEEYERNIKIINQHTYSRISNSVTRTFEKKWDEYLSNKNTEIPHVFDNVNKEKYLSELQELIKKYYLYES